MSAVKTSELPRPGVPGEASVTLQPPILAPTERTPERHGQPSTVPLAHATAAAALAAASVQSPTQVISQARVALDRLTTYQLNLRRQERVNGSLLPVEDVVMSIRRSPKAARLTWTDGPNRGREVLYRADEPGGLMHINMADSKLLPRISIAPDNPMVMKNSRHPITEAGLDPLVASLEAAERAGALADLGPQVISPFDHPLHGVIRHAENGDVWKAFFDPVNQLPALVECRTSGGDLVESYLFRDIQPDPVELASEAAFDADARWGPARGLFGRATARAATSGSTTTR